MRSPKKGDLDLVLILLIVAAVELTLNRLAVPELRPASPPIPAWHRDLDLVGLFFFHLSTVLALAVGAWKTIELVRARRLVLGARAMLAVVGTAFFGVAIYSVLFKPPAEMTFHLESCFTLLLILLSLAVALRPGDFRVKLGVAVLTIPFLLHFYGTFALRILAADDTSRGGALADQVRDLGQWSVVFASVAVALCFAPRPLWRSFLKPTPLALAGFVGALIAVVMIRHQDVGMEIASRGLGIDFAPGAPLLVIAAFVLAATAVVWTLASTLAADEPERRLLGMGLALVCVGGYAFTWPLTLLTVAAGMLAIADAATRIAPPAAAPQPEVDAGAWRSYTEALAGELGATLEHDGDVTVLRGERDDLPFVVKLARGAETAVEITFGAVPEEPPSLTVAARPERLLGGRSHPPPPASGAPLRRAGDPAFDDRFRMHDAGDVGGRVFDDGLRARAAALLDGWIAAWPGAGLRYRVVPGHGAPLDHPLPLGELRAGQPADPARLVRVFQLLAELAARLRS